MFMNIADQTRQGFLCASRILCISLYKGVRESSTRDRIDHTHRPVCIFCVSYDSRNCLVGILTRIRAGRTVFPFSARVRNFSHFLSVRGANQPHIQKALSLRVKRSEHKEYHSSPSSAEIWNVWLYTSPAPHAVMAYREKTLHLLVCKSAEPLT
jgi:hypothetical protein